MAPAADIVQQQLKSLEAHLERENPVLVSTVQGFRELDRVAYGMGLLARHESFATQISWWPLISILGTFSAGKSTFINHFLGHPLQRTGNQAVDERFSVICYSRAETSHALPGQALDSDPRFPFYQISKSIDEVAEGEGERIDAYLQLKTCPSERLRGRILIDSPGFDADAQRNATLRIADHIIDLSDLVLVFFDARHPEPGAMRDTLQHLVGRTINRADSGKFLFILNQIDTTAREDNPEDVVAAWQRALGEEGLTAGRFYCIYNPEAAVPIDDEAKRRRFEAKRDVDLSEIHQRMHDVEVERAYRIVGSLDKTAASLEQHTVPILREAMAKWRRRTLIGDVLMFGALLIAFLASSISAGHWSGLTYNPEWFQTLSQHPWAPYAMLGALIFLAIAAHFAIRKLAARSLAGWLRKRTAAEELRGDLPLAFSRSTKPWRSLFARSPAGWSGSARRRVRGIQERTDNYIQALNDRFTNPSGAAASKAGLSEDEPMTSQG